MVNERRFLITLTAIALGAYVPVAFSQEGHDPTVPPAAWVAAQPATDSAGQSQVSVKNRAGSGQMMVVGKTRRIAIVEGKVLKAGDEHNGTTVMAVRSDKVVMDDDAKSLALLPTVTKQKPARSAGVKGPVVLPAEGKSAKDKGV